MLVCKIEGASHTQRSLIYMKIRYPILVKSAHLSRLLLLMKSSSVESIEHPVPGQNGMQQR